VAATNREGAQLLAARQVLAELVSRGANIDEGEGVQPAKVKTLQTVPVQLHTPREGHQLALMHAINLHLALLQPGQPSGCSCSRAAKGGMQPPQLPQCCELGIL
jgi:hypothetical protein